MGGIEPDRRKQQLSGRFDLRAFRERMAKKVDHVTDCSFEDAKNFKEGVLVNRVTGEEGPRCIDNRPSDVLKGRRASSSVVEKSRKGMSLLWAG